MPLNASKVASDIASSYQGVLNDPSGDTLSLMAQAWENAIHSDAMKGQVPIAEPTPPANSGTIRSALMSCSTSSSSNVDTLANMFASYWATSHLTPKAPAVKIIGNDASSKVGAYKSAIQGAITDQLKEPTFEHLFKAVEAVTKTITWTGVDSNGSPVVGKIT